MTARAPVMAMALAVLVGCGEAAESETASEPTPSYAAIEAEIFEPACTFACHSGGEFAAGGLDMQSPPRATLVGVPATATACADSAWKRVVAGSPEESLLYVKVVAKLEGTAVPCGDGMPAGANKPALSAEEVARIRAWIEAGALDE